MKLYHRQNAEGIFVSKREEEVKSFITCEIHEGL
jgi:hypothetical protein